MAVSDGTNRTLEKRYDQDGTVYIKANAVGGATVNTGILVGKSATGWQTLALFNATTTALPKVFVGFPEQTLASGAVGWFQIGGALATAIISTTTATAGDMIKFSAAKLVSGGDANQTANCFGTFVATAASGLTHSVFLFDEMITAAD